MKRVIKLAAFGLAAGVAWSEWCIWRTRGTRGIAKDWS